MPSLLQLPLRAAWRSALTPLLLALLVWWVVAWPSLTAMTSIPSVPLRAAGGGSLQMPAIGYGVGTAWFNSGGDKSKELILSVQAALDTGFRHIDDAEMYRNEVACGQAIREWLSRSGTKREDLFITNKVYEVDRGCGAVCEEMAPLDCLFCSPLRFLIHSVCTRDGKPFKTSPREAWEQMMALAKTGKVKSIGVSNWRIADLESIKDLEIQPSCNQVEAHPFLQQVGLLQYCRKRDILVSCYGPQLPVTRNFIAGSPVEAPLLAAAERTGHTVGQVLLRWAYQTGRVPLTTSSKPERMKEYLAIFGFELTPEEVAAISTAGRRASQKRGFWQSCLDYYK
ncbi:unnamed protein product, partial [Symbiodinium microadriaticum]